jgi:hypothetical protein
MLTEFTNIHTQLKFIKEMLTAYPELAGPLSELHNTMLDYRTLVISNLFENATLDEFSLREEIKRLIK